MTLLTTDFIKIGQSGPTIDGRNIDPQLLMEAAETYEPTKYQARIWLDHYRFFGNFGNVLALDAREEGDVVGLYAKLQPSTDLVSLNKQGQYRTTSMELTPNFAQSGKCYLSGLAATDQPASLGTHEMAFSIRKEDEENIILCGVAFDLSSEQLTKAGEEPAPGWFTRFFEKRFPHLFTEKQPEAAGPAPADPEEEEPMDPKQFSELVGAIGAQTEAFKTLSGAIDQHFTAKPEEQKGDIPPADGEADGGKGGEDYSAQLSELTSSMQEMSKNFSAMSQRMEQAAGGTTAPENTNPAEGAGMV